ncbi:hypothetical protein BS78_06G051500 [Paspalum vaginatum]|nr:hypothetical protein BS78_06G051500 [Paspalum vaginatum]
MNELNAFFVDGWPQFMALHGITKADALLLRYEGNMVFTVKVFGPDGCQRRSMYKDGRMQRNELEITSTLNDTEKQQETCSSSRKGKSKKNWPGTYGHKRPKCSMTSLKKKKLRIVPTALGHQLGWRRFTAVCWRNIILLTLYKSAAWPVRLQFLQSLPRAFCNAIGLLEPCMITLQNSMDSASSWQVRGLPYKNGGCHLGSGWKKAFHDIGLKDGDILTLKVIKKALWDVIVKRS